ncbi:MAG: LysM domain-containing protein, partial [Chloroflexi bacterium]
NDNEASIDDNDNQAPAPGGCTVNPPAGWVTYTVQSGDTLSGIASRSGSSVGELVNVNCIANPSFISTGTTLWVPTNPGPPARPPRDDNDNEASFNNNDNDGSFNNNDNEASFNNNDNSDDSSGSNSGPGGGDDDHGDDDGSGGNSGRGGGDDDDSSGSNSGHGGGDDHNDDD